MLHSLMVGFVFVVMVCAPITFAIVSVKIQHYRKSR